MKKITLFTLLLLSSICAWAQFSPGQILTAAALNGQFALYAPLGGATFTGPVTIPTLTVTGATSFGAIQTSNATITGGSISGIAPLPVASGGTNSATASGASLDNITGFSGTGFLTRTGASAYSFVANPLPAANGGTGTTSLTQYNVAIGAGAALGFVPPGSTNYALLSNGASANPSFQQLTAPVVNYTSSLTGATTRTQASKNSDVVSVLDFGADPTGTVDSTSAINAAETAIVSSGATLIFPPGTYKETGLTIANNYVHWLALGTVTLIDTSTTPVLSIDGGASGSGIFGFSVEGNFVLQGNSSTPYALYIRAADHGSITDLKITAAATTAPAVRMEWAVADIIKNLRISTNEGFVSGLTPKYGVYMTNRADSTNNGTAANTFINPIIEGVTIGIYGDYAQGNLFVGGTSEANSSYGIQLTANSRDNTFQDMDLEANATADILDAGAYNQYVGMNSNSLAHLQGSSLMLLGGHYQNITIDSSAIGTVLANLRYNRNTGGSISDSGTSTAKINVRNDGTGALDSTTLASLPYVKLSDGISRRVKVSYDALPASGQAVGASPYVYTNSASYDVDASVEVGTVSTIEFSRNSGSTWSTVATSSNFILRLNPGDQMRITYSSAPTLVIIPR